MNSPLGMENLSSRSEKNLRQPLRMNPNNNQNTGGKDKEFDGEKNINMTQYGFKCAHNSVEQRKCQRERSK